MFVKFALFCLTKLERTWEHSAGINDKKWIVSFLPISDSFYLLCHNPCDCDISEHDPSECIWRVLVFASRFRTERSTFSFSSYDWGYLLTDGDHGTSNLLMISGIKFKVPGTNRWMYWICHFAPSSKLLF